MDDGNQRRGLGISVPEYVAETSDLRPGGRVMTKAERKRREQAKRRGAQSFLRQAITREMVDEALDDLERCGLIERTRMPNGEVHLRLPLAPAPACNGVLILEG